MLADSLITDAEFAEAQSKVVTCMRDHGWDVAWTSDQAGQLSQLTVASTAEMSVIQPDLIVCKDQWLGVAEAVYWATKNNPKNEDFDGLVAACLVRNGFAPPGFTGKDLALLIQEASITSDIDLSEGSVVVENRDDIREPVLPDGKPLTRPETITCLITPLAG
jgi:hypothetical protein